MKHYEFLQMIDIDYLTKHETSGIKVGDSVLVFREVYAKPAGARGKRDWHNGWAAGMSRAVGKVYKVIEDAGRAGFTLDTSKDYDKDYCFPVTALKKVNKQPH
jgi:hypothetical protein